MNVAFLTKNLFDLIVSRAPTESQKPEAHFLTSSLPTVRAVVLKDNPCEILLGNRCD